MAALYDILTERVCPRQQYAPLPINQSYTPSYTDLFPTKIRYCVGKRCLDIAIISIESDAIAGSTQSYHLSEDVVCLSALLFSTTILLWATVFIFRIRGPSKRTEKDHQWNTSQVPPQKAHDSTNGIHRQKGYRWSSALRRLLWPRQGRSSLSASCPESHSPAAVDSNLGLPPLLRDFASSNTDRSGASEDSPLTATAPNVEETSHKSSPRSLGGLPPQEYPGLPSSIDTHPQNKITPDATTAAFLTKADNGEQLSRKDRARLGKHASAMGLKQRPSGEPNLKAIFAKQATGEKLTRRQKKLLRENQSGGPHLYHGDGGHDGDAVEDSDIRSSSMASSFSAMGQGMEHDGSKIADEGVGSGGAGVDKTTADMTIAAAV